MMAWQDLDGHDLAVDFWPTGSGGGLQAWDAADEYMLRRVAEQPPAPGARIVLVDDRWGALGTALSRWRPESWGDSHLGRLALAANLERNGRAPDTVPFVPADTTPVGPFDLALVRLPKDLVCLDDTLRRLRGVMAPGALVLAGGMIKHTPTRAWRLLEQIVGATATTPGWKKARLGLARCEAPALPPVPLFAAYRLPEYDLEIRGAPGVFGGGRLDGGAALLLRHLPAAGAALDAADLDAADLDAADLGCGDGVLALALARRCPAARVLGVDESYRAVACARANLARNSTTDADAARVRLSVGDGLADVAPASLDLVLCNPPFHQGFAVADTAAERMFAQARAALKPGGRLLAVGNRHLGHHAKIERLFGHHELVDGDGRFVVVSAVRRG
jgi:16S rRNA (guanine1207-N2)-methyltransferase